MTSKNYPTAKNYLRNPGPWRKVTSYERVYPRWEHSWGNPNAHSKLLELECGHVKSQKGSVPVPVRTRCLECLDEETVLSQG